MQNGASRRDGFLACGTELRRHESECEFLHETCVTGKEVGQHVESNSQKGTYELAIHSGLRDMSVWERVSGV